MNSFGSDGYRIIFSEPIFERKLKDGHWKSDRIGTAFIFEKVIQYDDEVV